MDEMIEEEALDSYEYEGRGTYVSRSGAELANMRNVLAISSKMNNANSKSIGSTSIDVIIYIDHMKRTREAIGEGGSRS